MSPIIVAIFLPFAFATIVPILFKYLHRVHTGWFVLAVPLLLFGFFVRYYPIDAPEDIVVQSAAWIPRLDIEFAIVLDSLSLLFALLITGMGCLVVLYSIFYLSKEREALHNFYVYLLLFMGSMLGAVLSDHMLALYTFWELTSISSFLLIAYWYQRRNSRYGALKSLLITMTGGFAMLLGMLMLRAATGTYSIRETIALADTLAEHPLFLPAMALILLGAFAKSAQFPFHIWLPDAMEAPTPISAYLHSATMVKAGIYLVARLTPIFGGHPEWSWSIVIVGLLTLLWGSFTAIRQVDLKAMLAFSTVSQLGLIMSLLGIGSMALTPHMEHGRAILLSGAVAAALFHLINHSVFKGCLFMVIGILDHELGTRDIRRLGGLAAMMPVSFTLTVIGAFSMAGLPPFSGFLSKEMFFTGMLAAYRTLEGWTLLLPAVAWLASVLTFVYCMILVFRVFTGPKPEELPDKPPHEAPIGMLISPSVLAAAVVLLFFAPNILSGTILEPSMRAILPQTAEAADGFHVHIAPWHGFTAEVGMTAGVVLIGAYLYRRRRWLERVRDFVPWRWTLNRLFDWTLAGMERISLKFTRLYMTGFTGHYFAYIFGFLILLAGGALIALQALRFDFSDLSPILPYEYALGGSVVASAVYMLFARSRIASIIALSAIGFLVALFFIIFRAPDLALTQFVVETISTALFLLCFVFWPKLKEEDGRLPFRVTRLLISVGVGAVVTLIGLAAIAPRPFESIARFFENSYELAGARNIVNAILVDFRGFDTMLEIVVLFMAGLGVYSLIRFGREGRKDG
ncbi:MAG TPA: Na+/H+ antiporter subunit A [Paenibacillaceae bacterium]